MRPTVDEQLAGLDRLLEQVAADPALGPESGLLLRDARRQLARLRGSLDLRSPFLRWDNAASAAVLRAVAPHLPAEVATRVDQVVTAPGPGTDERQLVERNDALRSLLSEALDALVDGEEGQAAQRLIVDHLQTRVTANPALSRNPVIPELPHD